MKKSLIFLLILSVWSSHIEATSTYLERFKRNAVKNRNQLWPRGVVPYSLDSPFRNSFENENALETRLDDFFNSKPEDFFRRGIEKLPQLWQTVVGWEERASIYRAMNAIIRVSCIRFVRRTNQRGYISIKKGSGCSAVVGYTGGKQNVNLGKGCFGKSTVIHELMHALGFHHEHNRPDRDDFVVVLRNNIHANKFHNFEKKPWHSVTTLGEVYDPKSVMHYRNDAFSIRQRGPSLRSRNNRIQITPSNELSSLDVRKLNKLYQCRWGR